MTVREHLRSLVYEYRVALSYRTAEQVEYGERYVETFLRLP
jgi:hypothetical protein